MFFLKKNQLSAPELKQNIILTKQLKKDGAVYKKFIKKDKDFEIKELIFSYLYELKGMLNYQSISIGSSFDLEISHHRGIKILEKLVHFI